MNENPLSTLEAAMIVGAIIQIITLIVFFVLANNVAKIKKTLNAKNASSYIEAAKMEAYLGNKQAAIDNYMRAKYRCEIETEYESEYNNTAQDIDKAISELRK